MRFTSSVLGITAVGLALATGCTRQVGTTEVTSAPVRTSASDPAAMRLADEMCGRASSCNEIGKDGKYRTEEACQSDQGIKAPAEMKRWACTPSQDALDLCLAAIRGEKCETQVSQLDALPQCTSSAVCGR
ncbi:MAG: hypothetical protein JWP97_2412 [Labilithrix sp.]|nr:hypothetical protein [Labilithrix sp.]